MLDEVADDLTEHLEEQERGLLPWKPHKHVYKILGAYRHMFFM